MPFIYTAIMSSSKSALGTTMITAIGNSLNHLLSIGQCDSSISVRVIEYNGGPSFYVLIRYILRIASVGYLHRLTYGRNFIIITSPG